MHACGPRGTRCSPPRPCPSRPSGSHCQGEARNQDASAWTRRLARAFRVSVSPEPRELVNVLGVSAREEEEEVPQDKAASDPTPHRAPKPRKDEIRISEKALLAHQERKAAAERLKLMQEKKVPLGAIADGNDPRTLILQRLRRSGRRRVRIGLRLILTYSAQRVALRLRVGESSSKSRSQVK